MAKKVLVGMSGGIDSSVAAYILKEKGYDVIGVTLNLWSFEEYGGEMVTDRGCCSLEQFADARNVANQIGIPYYVLNFRDTFKENVVENFKSEYMKGRTPNPCVLCNTIIKWRDMLKKADFFGCDYIATGHYAKMRYNEETKRYEILRGDDPKKDQSYFLYGLTQESLSRTLFPLSEMTKEEVRTVAEKIGLKTAKKKESMEICFIPDNDYKRFLNDNVPEIKKIKHGKMYDNDGKILDRKHEGYPYYTVGQRKGLGGGFSEPMYVKNIDANRNTVTIGKKNELYSNTVRVNNVNWVGKVVEDEMRCTAKIRFNTTDKPCTVKRISDDEIEIIFDNPVFAVTPGQSCVMYDGEILIGGGLIIG